MEINNTAIKAWIETINSIAGNDEQRQETIDMLWSSLLTLDKGAEDILYIATCYVFETDNGFLEHLILSKLELYYSFLSFSCLKRISTIIIKAIRENTVSPGLSEKWTNLVVKMISQEKLLADSK